MIPAWKQLGLMIGIVSNRADPEGLGRVKVRYPTLKDSDDRAREGIESDWARVLTPYGGKDHGLESIPEEGDEVVVGFMEGDPKIPLIVGSVYSKKNAPPTREVDERIFKSRKGHTIVVSDQAGKERIELRTRSGQHVTIDEGSKTITIEAKGSVSVVATNTVTLEANRVIVNAPDVRLGGELALQPAVLGTILEGILNTLVPLLTTHFHETLVGPTLPSEILATLPEVIEPQLALLLSKKVKVE